MKYLLDTNVISELASKKPDKNVVTWISNIDEDELFLSCLTIGEIQKGIEQLPDSGKKTRLALWLKDELLTRFTGKILEISHDTAVIWGRTLASKGKVTTGVIDSLIAATAIQHELTLVTRNIKDFVAYNLRLFNPWQERTEIKA